MDKHEYSDEIDLRDFVDENNPKLSYMYSLFAVLVHSGEHSAAGHYYVFIKPDFKEGTWYKFNDS